MKEKQITVIIKEPGQPPRLEPFFDNTLESFQAAVGGYIETMTPFSDLVAIVNEEGRIKKLPFNCTVLGCPVYGTVVLAGVKRDEFCSIPARFWALAESIVRGEST